MKEYNASSEEERITEALDAMKAAQGEAFCLEKVNLAELERRTGVSRARLRHLKENGFEFKPHGNKGRKAEKTVLTGYTSTIDTLLIAGVTNSSVILERLQDRGFLGSLTVVKEYIAAHRNLVPAKRQFYRDESSVSSSEEALFFALGALSIKGAPRRVQNRPFWVHHVFVSICLSMGRCS